MSLRFSIRCTFFAIAMAITTLLGGIAVAQAPAPLTAVGQSATWWFTFKFNGAKFPACAAAAQRQCQFDNSQPQPYATWGQQYVTGNSQVQTLQAGQQCVGDTTSDPVGATFAEIYGGQYHYVIWNDQFKGDPKIAGCTGDCGSPWGHSKGALAWDDTGNGFVLQVTTPSWPGAGSKDHPRSSDGNTLGCVTDDNVLYSQHFFSLRLTKDDLTAVLQALANASVVTDPSNPQIVANGGPPDIQKLVSALGKQSASDQATMVTLSTGIQLISKPSSLHVPPWQMVSALLDGVALRTATWWATPKIGSSTSSTQITCWDPRLRTPGPVEIASTGQFGGTVFGLTGGPAPNANHAKIGVSTGGAPLTIFGDMNQQGTLSGANCGSSQNGRGGLFFVVNDQALHDQVAGLIKGGSEPTE